MGEDICFLITMSDGTRLTRCGLKVKKTLLSGGCLGFLMENNVRRKIYSLLPLHVKTIGNIVDIEEIFEIHTIQL